MSGDPDWGEIVDRSIQIRSDALDAPSIRLAPASELAEALAAIINEEVEQHSRLEIMLLRMSVDFEFPNERYGFPGLSHGVGLSARRVALLIELHRRVTSGEYLGAT